MIAPLWPPFCAHINLVVLPGERLRLRPAAVQQVLHGAVVRDVQSAPKLNGLRVSVVGYEGGRFVVVLPDGRPGSLAPSSVRLPDGTRVAFVGLTTESGAEWNGRWGRVDGFDAVRQRYIVAVPPARQLRVRPENLRT